MAQAAAPDIAEVIRQKLLGILKGEEEKSFTANSLVRLCQFLESARGMLLSIDNSIGAAIEQTTADQLPTFGSSQLPTFGSQLVSTTTTESYGQGGQGARKQKAKAKKNAPLREATRAQLLSMLPDGQPFTAKVASSMLQFGKAAIAALAVDEDVVMPLSYGGGSMYGQQQQAETFGAKLTRELVATLPEILRSQKESPEALVKALAAAREAGLNDVAESLERKLLGSKPNGQHEQHHEVKQGQIGQ